MSRFRPRAVVLAVLVSGIFPGRPAPAQTRPVKVLSFSPAEVSYLGKTPFEVGGEGFIAGARVLIDGLEIVPTSVSPTKLTGTLPLHVPMSSPAAVSVRNGDGGSDSLPDAVRYIGPLGLTAANPANFAARKGGPITITGIGFTPQTAIEIGTTPLIAKTFVDARTITGTAPALVKGTYDVRAIEAGAFGPPITATLTRGVAYTAPFLAAPQEMESSLAEGTARFSWHNPVPYSEIRVLNKEGRVIQTLLGNATFLELPAGSLDQLDLGFQGTTLEADSTITEATARIHECDRPPPLGGAVEPGDLQFFLYGGHQEAGVAGCPGVPGGGGGDVAGAGGGVPAGGGGIIGGGPGTIGHITTAADIAVLPLAGRNRVTTGFELEHDADFLEIRGYYQKLATDFGLELRGHLVHVYPADGFEDEFAFPDPFIDEEPEWHALTYYRSYLDEEGVRRPCLDENGELRKIPQGQYLLHIYATGGDSRLPYYAFADDPRDNELLIAGAPCPPYPMVSVRDVTGFATLPEPCIQTSIWLAPGDLFENLVVSLHAVGTWFDEDLVEHRINPLCILCDGDTEAQVLEGDCPLPDYLQAGGIEYVWTIWDQEVPTTKSSGSSPDLQVTLPDWGCYKVALEVRDRGCNFSIKRYFELPFVPANPGCPPGQPYSFRYPTPEPGGVFAIAGLNPPPGNGEFQGTRPVEFRVLALPECYCTPVPNGCAAAQLVLDSDEAPEDHLSDAQDDIQFRFATRIGLQYVELDAPLKALDLCPNVEEGPKYFLVRIDDLGLMAANPWLGEFSFKSVVIQAKANFRRRKLPSGGTTRDAVTDTWHTIGKPFRVTNYPEALDHGFWSGHFDERDASYHFVIKSTAGTEVNHDLGESPAIPLDIPGVDIEIPGHEHNNVSSGFTARFMMAGGVWSPETGDGTMSGNVLGNQLQGKSVRPQPVTKTVSGLAGDGAGGLATPELPSYEWCHSETIFKNNFSQELFDAIIYTGFIGPVPVEIRAAVGLGLAYSVDSIINTKVSPFAFLDSGNYVETGAWLISTVGISIPCEVSADILGGIASIAMKLIPEANFSLGPHVVTHNTEIDLDYYLRAVFNLYFEVEACIQTIVFGEQCFSPGRIAIVEGANLLAPHGDKLPEADACGGGGTALAANDPDAGGQGGGVIVQNHFEVTNAPVSVLSPDAKTQLVTYVKSEGGGELVKVTMNGQSVKEAILPGSFFYVLNPAAAFVSNQAALLSWTEPTGTLVEVVDDAEDPAYLTTRNANARRTNIAISPIAFNPVNDRWEIDEPIQVSDEGSGVSPDHRADGMSSLSGDLSDGTALVAWVRYDTPDMLIQDGFKSVAIPCPEGQICPIPAWEKFYRDTVPNFRPQMERTAIYVRRVDLEGGLGGKVKVSGPGINIEPSISVAPSGDVAYCAWVNDPVHTNLIDSNRGRKLKFAVYAKAADAWGPPADVIPNPDDYPGILEPQVLLKDSTNGLIAFTALPQSASEKDTGLGGNRLVFGVRLENGVFGEPFLIHGKCDAREYGFSQTLATNVPILSLPGGMHVPLPEWVIVYQGTGPLGQRAGSGNVMVSVLGKGSEVWSAPINLTPDNNIHSNVAAAIGGGMIRAIHLNGGPATYVPGSGAGAGAAARSFEFTDVALEPDLAITACRLSDQFAAPGSRVKATVELENLGLAGVPETAEGRIAAGIQATFRSADGKERMVRALPAVQIPPGGRQSFEFLIEMPHEPVELRIQLNPNPVDRDRSNDAHVCYFGAPPPRDLQCRQVRLVVEEAAAGVELSWANPAVYEEVLVYRDGGMIAALPGKRTRFMDLHAEPGEHSYSLRGRIGVSKSVRAECRIIVEPPAERAFRRGDADGNGVVNITDPIQVLDHLFRGAPAFACEDAADADDNGLLQITDPIRILGFLFTGGDEPPAPGPRACGPDPTADGLRPCDPACK